MSAIQRIKAVHAHNLAVQRSRLASVPEVGIFWLIDDELVANSIASSPRLDRPGIDRPPDVARVDRVRGGPRGSGVFVDVEVSVGRTLPLERVADINRKSHAGSKSG